MRGFAARFTVRRLIALVIVATVVICALAVFPILAWWQQQDTVRLAARDVHIEDLVNDLLEGNLYRRARARRAFEDLGPAAAAAVPRLTEALREAQSSQQRMYLATLLVTIQGENYQPAQAAFQIVGRDNALVDAAAAGDLLKVQELLEAGANVDARYMDFNSLFGHGSGWTATMKATLAQDAETVCLLLSAGAEVDLTFGGKSALYFAAQADCQPIVDLLLQAGAAGDPQEIRSTEALILAACRGFAMQPGEEFPRYPGVPDHLADAPSIPEVLDQGADVNGTTPQGYTPLMYAANLLLVENVQTLLDRGADVHAVSAAGETALTLAKESNGIDEAKRAAVMNMLIDAERFDGVSTK